MIDINKCRISFETSDKGSDEGYCDVDGTKMELRSKTQKVDVLIALSGEAGTLDKPSRKWTQICQPCKYSKFFSYYSFAKKILDDLPHGNEGKRYCITMDDLNNNETPAIVQLIYTRGHLFISKAPSFDIDSPVTKFFNASLKKGLTKRSHLIHSSADLTNEIENALFYIIDFKCYFREVGIRK